MNMELVTLARACGKSDVHHLEREDLVALNVEAAAMAKVKSPGDGRNDAGRLPRLRGRYSAWSLFRHALTGEDWPLVWRSHELKPSYDVVIIGAGVHGLAAAYYLARNHGIRAVAVLDRGYLGGGNSGRNTAIVRSN
jgi:sarcosine oxidase subunit beta